MFRRITRRGTLGASGLDVDSVIPLLRRILADAGVNEARTYSSHSLRRGLAGWATANGWDLKTLMQYVGWKDIQTAARYVDAMPDDRSPIERGLAQTRSGTPTATEAVRAGLEREEHLRGLHKELGGKVPPQGTVAENA